MGAERLEEQGRGQGSARDFIEIADQYPKTLTRSQCIPIDNFGFLLT